jgi:hypothetical protein
MTRSHVLLHCPSERMCAARAEAWEGRDPGGLRALLANPRWEKRLVKFLELSGAGRIVAGGVDEEAAWAEKMDEWMDHLGRWKGSGRGMGGREAGDVVGGS